ncbi:hypothetical protein NPIL_56181 [Nephila pilipes]|uniref:Uncharacterized protein n=1 Tax=Nephila pilipes TaxID=299642 RepID=A0A8X6NWT0_NEPPI|nr:hypothetical protein NPIL_56181 [Nephila pilipes]
MKHNAFIYPQCTISKPQYTFDIINKINGKSQRRPLYGMIKEQMSNVIGCLVSLQSVCLSRSSETKEQNETYRHHIRRVQRMCDNMALGQELEYTNCIMRV